MKLIASDHLDAGSYWHWADDAACDGLPVNLFFNRATEEQALSVCGTCPIKKQCLEHAVEESEVHGVWGGVSQKNRRQIIRRAWRRDLRPEHWETLQANSELDSGVAVAERLGVTPGTVSYRLRRMKDTLNFASTDQMISTAIDLGVIQ